MGWATALTAALVAALASTSSAEAGVRDLQVIHFEEAWNVMSPDGLVLAKELAGEHLIGVGEIDVDGDGHVSKIEFLDHCAAGKVQVVIDFPCCR